MLPLLPEAGSRFRVLSTRVLHRFGLSEDAFLLLPAVLIGVAAAVAAVAFHELITLIRDLLYATQNPNYLYGRGMWLLLLWPTAGGLAVGVMTRLFRSPGHGVPDVIESVVRSEGFIPPSIAIQKIITASATIGTGGSAGAEGPIVQVGAAIASAVGRLFRIARHSMPILVGCGAAAGISAVFNAPIGGVLFTLEVILQDYSIRAFTPLMISSVIANVATRAIMQDGLQKQYGAIFELPPEVASGLGPNGMLSWQQLPNFALLGIVCGLVAVSLTRLMIHMEDRAATSRLPAIIRPALGGAAVGALGVCWVYFGQLALGTIKPISFERYPMPAFFGDGYGVVQQLLSPSYYIETPSGMLIVMALLLCGLKLLATCLTLASGGSGGVIAPSLYLGATAGAALGVGLQKLSIFPAVFPSLYALIGMGAVLGAVVHAPLAAILILLELTSDFHVIMPAMLATIFAVGTARFFFRESVYTHTLRKHGVRLGMTRDAGLLRCLSIEQIGMEPALLIRASTPFSRVLALMGENIRDAAIVSDDDTYVGILRRQDIEKTLLQPDSIPLLLASELCRSSIPLLSSVDDLGKAMELFTSADVEMLAVSLPEAPGKVVGMVSQAFIVKRYHEMIDEKR